MKCTLCDAEAIAIYYFDKGCVCSKKQMQPLCEHHIYKATPINGMKLIKDLTIDHEYSNFINIGIS
jgi:succinate dehydrogenase/fumarate reductase-like Fe-S protein